MIQDEIFEPVTGQRFDVEDKVLAWANDVCYGLASRVWTTDHGRAMRMANDRLRGFATWPATALLMVA